MKTVNSNTTMITVKKVAVFIVYICVLALAFVLTYFQIKSYLANRNTSFIAYRKFNTEPKDIYPSFSICLYSSFGLIFNQNKEILGVKGWRGGHLYRKMLLGEDSILTRYIYREINFDEVKVDMLKDIIKAFHTVTKQGTVVEDKEIQKWGVRTPYTFGYQDPNQICVTRKRLFEKELILNYEKVTIDTEMMYNITADLHVYIHRPGELTRILHRPILSFSLNDFKEILRNPQRDNHYHLQINQVEATRNRPDDAINPCNETLFDDDEMYRNVIIQKIGCIPAYWKRFQRIHSNYNIPNLPECFQQNQLYRINKSFLPDLNVGNATKEYLKPCNSMKTIMNVVKYSASERRTLVIQLDHVYEEYKVCIDLTCLFILESDKVKYYTALCFLRLLFKYILIGNHS